MSNLRTRRGFTLMELLVVIAIIALLVTVMVPVVLGFMKGRGLSMSSNNIGGIIAFARSEAMNARQTHAIVCFTEEETVQTGGMLDLKVGPGIAVYRLVDNPGPNESAVNFVKQLSFRGQIGADVNFSPRWIYESPKGPIQPYLSDAANSQFSGKYKIAVLPDGRLIIPEDKPGYILDTGDTKRLNTDLALSDGDSFVYIDINAATGTVKRSNVLTRSETQETD
jgi:prepilin-type N-terminal cleavage/methylation domain-containing protein